MNLPQQSEVKIILQLLWPHKVSSIRLGRGGDGGYVVPHAALQSVDRVISCGVGTDWSFETSLRRLLGLPRNTFTFVDPTIGLYSQVKSLIYILRRSYYEIFVKKLPKSQRKYRPRDFRRQMISVPMVPLTFGQGCCRLPLIRKWVTDKVSHQSVTLNELLKGRTVGPSYLLKVDIEGAEYSSLASLTPESINKIAVLVVEFHSISNNSVQLIEIARLLSECLLPTHLHGNTSSKRIGELQVPNELEVTFVNRSLIDSTLEKAESLWNASLDRCNRQGESGWDLRRSDLDTWVAWGSNPGPPD